MKGKIFTCSRAFAALLLMVLFCVNIHAEKRYYFTRGGELPTGEGLETVDLRQAFGVVDVVPNQITLNPDYPYTYYNKPAKSWFSFNQNKVGQAVDMSDVNADFDNWYLKLKVQTDLKVAAGAAKPELNVILNGVGAAENAFPLSEEQLPRDGKWHVLTLKLTDYTASQVETLKNSYTASKTGTIFQMHGADNIEAGFLAIDYAYLTNDPTGVDEGIAETLVTPKRYYLLTNSETPAAGVMYEKVDYSASIDAAAEVSEGWSMPDYAEYPYYTVDGTAANVSFTMSTTAADVDLDGVDAAWALKAKIKSNTTGTVKLSLFDCEGAQHTYTVPAENLTGEWSALNVALSDFQAAQEAASYDCAKAADADVLKVEIENAAEGEIFYLGYVYLTNEAADTAADPDPKAQADPNWEQRVYLINDGSPLPEDMNCTDYRIGVSENIKLAIGGGNTLIRDDAYEYLYFNTLNTGWWSFDVQPEAGKNVDLTSVAKDWYLNVKIKTEVTHRPINLYLYAPGQVNYELTEARYPVAKNGEWVEMEIPLTEYAGGNPVFANYTSGNILSLHANGAGVAEAVVAIEHLYFSNKAKQTGPTTSAPQVNGGDVIGVSCFGNQLLVDNLAGTSQIRIVNLNGKTVSTDIVSGETFSKLLDMPQGIYLVEVISGNLPKKVAKIIL